MEKKTYCFDLDGTLLDSKVFLQNIQESSKEDWLNLKFWIEENKRLPFNKHTLGQIFDIIWNYTEFEPMQDRIDCVNKLYDKGNKIIIYTARNNQLKLNQEYYYGFLITELITEFQLDYYKIKYHELIIGYKPDADYYIDDKGINDKDFFNNKRGKYYE